MQRKEKEKCIFSFSQGLSRNSVSTWKGTSIFLIGILVGSSNKLRLQEDKLEVKREALCLA